MASVYLTGDEDDDQRTYADWPDPGDPDHSEQSPTPPPMPETPTWQQTEPPASARTDSDPFANLPSGISRDWAEDFIKRNPGDYGRIESAYQSNNTSSQGREFDSQGPMYDQDTHQLSALGRATLAARKAQQQRQPVSTSLPQPERRQIDPQFEDEITKYIEEAAQRRAQERENPSAGSGQALLEQALKDIAEQFKSGGYTNAEQEIFTTQQMDPLEKLRQARRKQVELELSRRGIAPNSGVAIQLLQDVDRQFDQIRVSQQANLAGKFADERMARLLQSLGLYGNLAGQENARLNEGFQYRTVPLTLADRSFSQGMQLFNAAEGSANNAYNRMAGTYNQSGNPLALVNPLLSMMGQQQGQSDSQQRALADLIWALTRGGGN